MALKKKIILNNGITMEYHRIAEISNVVNKNTTLVINSYINQEQRDKEKNSDLKYNNDIYKVVDRVHMRYNDTLDIVSAYKYLKQVEKYKDAEDIFEESEV